MIIFEGLSGFAEYRTSLSSKGAVAFVPTMGNLHEGHLRLVDEAKKISPTVIVSIFVNGKQFNDANDYKNYPRSLEADREALRARGVNALFLPKEKELYPDDYTYRLHETDWSRELCGAHRPGHFDGVLTVVLKLLNIVKPQFLVMGLKDFQQFTLIEGMIAALFLPVKIIGVETVREADGLAMSSRNARLSSEARKKAMILPRILSDFSQSDEEARRKLESEGFAVDYLTRQRGRRFVAAHLANVRLIDNVALRKGEKEQSNDLES